MVYVDLIFFGVAYDRELLGVENNLETQNSKKI